MTEYKTEWTVSRRDFKRNLNDAVNPYTCNSQYYSISYYYRHQICDNLFELFENFCRENNFNKVNT